MAAVEFRQKIYREPADIKNLLREFQIPYENWGVRSLPSQQPEAVLNTYAEDVSRLKKTRGYVTEDVIALDPDMPGLDELLAKFSKEHHHTDDEVRFVVAGEGVFEINVNETERVKITTHPGDLIVVPAWRRHLFYLTSARTIRCIRLFKDKSGWEAHYPYASLGSPEHVAHFVSPS